MAHSNTSCIYDIIIIGAGPAGCTTALALKDSGLRVALIDKYFFPRDKVCGDAIPGGAIKCLKEIDASFTDDLNSFQKKILVRKTTCFYNNRQVDFNWVQDAYISARVDFDDFLLRLVKDKTETIVFEGTEIKDIIKEENGFSIISRNNKKVFRAKMLIGADGINGVTAKKLAGYQMNRKHHIASVRAYYSNIANIEEMRNEVYFDKKYLPGYFWIFPLGSGRANVGFGLLSYEVVKKNINIKKAFYDFIDRSEVLKIKFKGAQPQGDLQGCGIPLGSRWVTMSGDHFILTGDAASLVNPLSGAGIDNAVISGKLAAAQCLRAFAVDDFSAGFMEAYDKKLYDIIGIQLKKNGLALKYFSRLPFLISLAFLIGKNNFIKKFIK